MLLFRDDVLLLPSGLQLVGVLTPPAPHHPSYYKHYGKYNITHVNKQVALAVYCVLFIAAVNSAPSHGFVSPVILPKVHLASPDVTVVRQPYVVQQTEPVFRHVYYAGDSVPYVSHHVQAYHQQPAVVAAYHTAPAYAPAVGYVVWASAFDSRRHEIITIIIGHHIILSTVQTKNHLSDTRLWHCRRQIFNLCNGLCREIRNIVDDKRRKHVFSTNFSLV